eukprot:TRINITY_DN59921_c0_g1_i1.p2 TRINITY_DN59921_c0_g1~~TRINITY_DN59921_c0_g1_i1.p2  ORF type:complete len:148 (-),score=27.64 TRINITY_DN59921_c0_g1_i1:496-939(-)
MILLRWSAALVFPVAAEAALPTEVRKFRVGDNASLTHLQKEGFVVYEGIASLSEVRALRSLFWDFLEGVGTGINRSNPRTWRDDAWPTPQGGIIGQFGIGQSDFMWAVRRLPHLGSCGAPSPTSGVREIFSFPSTAPSQGVGAIRDS